MSSNPFPHLCPGLPNILENVYIFVRHFSIAGKLSWLFFPPSLLDFFGLWSVSRMHPTKHLSTHLTPNFSGVTDVFTVNDTYIYMGLSSWQRSPMEKGWELCWCPGSWTSDSPNSLLNFFKKPCNSGLRPRREFSIPCQYAMIQCSDLMLLSEWRSHGIYLPWLTKREENPPVCKHVEYSLGCKLTAH